MASSMNGGIAGINYVVLVFEGAYSVRTTVTASARVASSWVQEVLRSFSSITSEWVKVVGLATESQPNLPPGNNQPAAVLQLCVDDNCLIFQLLHCNSVIPPVLRSFLDDPRFYFVCVEMVRDADRLQREHGLSVRNAIDLRVGAMLALQRMDLVGADMKRLVREVMGIEMERPEAVRTSAWQQRVLSSQQIAYACAGAFASFMLGHILIHY